MFRDPDFFRVAQTTAQVPQEATKEFAQLAQVTMNEYILDHCLKIQPESLLRIIKNFIAKTNLQQSVTVENFDGYRATVKMQAVMKDGSIKVIGFYPDPTCGSVRVAQIDFFPLNDDEMRVQLAADQRYDDRLLYQIQLAETVIKGVGGTATVEKWYRETLRPYWKMVREMAKRRGGALYNVAMSPGEEEEQDNVLKQAGDSWNVTEEESLIGTKASYQRTLKTYDVNLAQLEEQAARHGMDVPISIQNEIAFTKEKIAEIKEKLAELEDKKKRK